MIDKRTSSRRPRPERLLSQWWVFNKGMFTLLNDQSDHDQKGYIFEWPYATKMNLFILYTGRPQKKDHVDV